MRTDFQYIDCEKVVRLDGIRGIPAYIGYMATDKHGFTKDFSVPFTREEQRTIFDIMEAVHDRAQQRMSPHDG